VADAALELGLVEATSLAQRESKVLEALVEPRVVEEEAHLKVRTEERRWPVRQALLLLPCLVVEHWWLEWGQEQVDAMKSPYVEVQRVLSCFLGLEHRPKDDQALCPL
jgi:hypothetical protein